MDAEEVKVPTVTVVKTVSVDPQSQQEVAVDQPSKLADVAVRLELALVLIANVDLHALSVNVVSLTSAATLVLLLSESQHQCSMLCPTGMDSRKSSYQTSKVSILLKTKIECIFQKSYYGKSNFTTF